MFGYPDIDEYDEYYEFYYKDEDYEEETMASKIVKYWQKAYWEEHQSQGFIIAQGDKWDAYHYLEHVVQNCKSTWTAHAENGEIFETAFDVLNDLADSYGNGAVTYLCYGEGFEGVCDLLGLHSDEQRAALATGFGIGLEWHDSMCDQYCADADYRAVLQALEKN